MRRQYIGDTLEIHWFIVKSYAMCMCNVLCAVLIMANMVCMCDAWKARLERARTRTQKGCLR